jgi:2-polyprenyl-3-methyl-5-hydroxy-6-metoxy-1,4-benzoquinol methylase
MNNKTVLSDTIKEIKDHNKFDLNDNDLKFLERVYKDGINKYNEKLESINFSNFDDVLDAGCGFGQWSIALAQKNKNVTSFDISEKRIDALNFIIDRISIPNIQTEIQSTEKFSEKKESYDAVFCYSVMFNNNWKLVIDKFSKLLKKNGVLYICSNNVDWYISNILYNYNPSLDYNPKEYAIKSIKNTISSLYSLEISTDDFDMIVPSNILSNYLKFDFSIERCGPENSFFKQVNKDQESVYEIIAIKK